MITLARFYDAAAGIVRPSQNCIDDGRGAAHPGCNGNRFGGTIPGAGATFHTGIPEFDPGLSPGKTQDRPGADFYAGAAADTPPWVEIQGNDIL